ncbi:MAG: metallophosphoesterase [Cyanobacteria bacterium P01_H01_bin.74]
MIMRISKQNNLNFNHVKQAIFSRVLLGLFIIFLAGFSDTLQGCIAAEIRQDQLKKEEIVDHFIALGDWGAGTPFQKQVAAQLATFHQAKPYASVFMLGDNIYPAGDVIKRGEQYFETMYAPLIEKKVNFIVALGNHDVIEGHGQEQIEYFKMPNNYYLKKLNTADCFIIDSNTFAEDEKQQQWLAKALHDAYLETPNRWRFVMGHHPIYSSGAHRNDSDMKQLKQKLEPLLINGHVDFYLAGHEHDYERFSAIDSVVHVVSGGGGAYLRDLKTPYLPHSLVQKKAHHFLSFQVSTDTVQYKVIDSAGGVIDEESWSKKAFSK